MQIRAAASRRTTGKTKKQQRIEEARRRVSGTVRLTVLTETISHTNPRKLLNHAIRESLGRGAADKYHVIALPRLAFALADQRFVNAIINTIVEGMRDSLEPKVLIAPIHGGSREIMRRLNERSEFADGNTRIFGTDIVSKGKLRKSETIIVTCTDHRLHSHASFINVTSNHLRDPRGFGVMAIPGGPAGLRRESEFCELSLSQLEASVRQGMRRIVLLGHTDCVIHGGSPCFANINKELEVISEDLHLASKVLARSFPKVTIQTGTLRLRGGSCKNIR